MLVPPQASCCTAESVSMSDILSHMIRHFGHIKMCSERKEETPCVNAPSPIPLQTFFSFFYLSRHEYYIILSCFKLRLIIYYFIMYYLFSNNVSIIAVIDFAFGCRIYNIFHCG